ncbi:glycosyltransferase family 4 protein [Hyphococcus sp.]|uniref:glycosyltransferase family 4 protein n=1 Tax=Hyphococcus sp. TaxID=2038636 RepID=UPI003CCBC0E4
MLAQTVSDEITGLVVVPDDAGAELRRLIGLKPDDDLRISYITGPGDVHGTYEYWLDGKLDPRVPTVAKTAMYYELCRKVSARCQLVADVQPGRAPHDEGDVRFDYIPRARGGNAARYYWTSARRIKHALAEIRKFSPHFVVACTDFPGYGLPLLKAGGAKLIFSLHNTFWTKGAAALDRKEMLANAGRRRWLKSVDAALCTSLECERQFQELTNGEIKTFRNMPQQRVPGFQREPQRRDGKRKLLYLGRTEKAKGVFDLLAAYKNLCDTYDDIELVFAGDGHGAGALGEAISAMGDPRVRYLGRLSAEDVFAQLQDTYLVVCPTRNAFKEGLALVVIEAAVYGVPSVMSTAVPASYLLPQSGEVYEADSVEGLTASIDLFLKDRDFQLDRARLALAESRNFFKREQSWGSYLYQAMVEAAGD